jgi:hypothetical protein
MEKSNINVVVEAMSHIRAIRLDLNRNLTDAKLEIKENAIKLFMELCLPLTAKSVLIS